MIYKGGPQNLGNLKAEHLIVHTYEEHMMWLEIWGDKRPDGVAKVEKKVENVETNVADDSAKEVKPRRGRKPKNT